MGGKGDSLKAETDVEQRQRAQSQLATEVTTGWLARSQQWPAKYCAAEADGLPAVGVGQERRRDAG